MVDLETLGVTPSAPIIALGAVQFNPTTGEINEEGAFYERIDWGSACVGRTIDTSTIKWWMKQDDKARLEVIASGKTVKRTLDLFDDWWNETSNTDVAHPRSQFVWGNGACFDVSMLESLYALHQRQVPWKFWDVRDVRTIVHMSKDIIEMPLFEGVKHHAKADAIHQAKYVSTMWRTLTEGFD